MPKTPSKKKDKTAASSNAAKRKGQRGNHAAFFAPLPPTPPRKPKRKTIISDDEDEPQVPVKKLKPSDERRRAKDADRDAGNPDRRSARPPTSGNRRDDGNPLPSPRPSSPPPPSSSPPPDRGSSSRHNPSPHESGQRESGQRDSRQRDSTKLISQDQSPQHVSDQSSSNACASRPAPSSPGRAFADSLKAAKAFANEGQDEDDLNLQEDNIKRKKSKSKSKTKVVNEDEEDEEDKDDEEDDEEEGEDDEQDEDDIGNADDEELSTEAVDKLMKVIRSRKKQKYSLSKKQSNPDRLPRHFKKWGRHAHRLCGVYTNIFKTITTGMMVMKLRPETAEEYDQCYKAVPNMSAPTAKFYTKKFMYLCDHVPKLKALFGHLLFRSGDMFVFAKFFKKHAAAGRSSDISTLKRNFASYLPRVAVSQGVVIRPLTQVEYANKSRNGGYYSVCTGRLVLPIHERDAFDEDPVAYNKSKANEHKAFARQTKRHKTDRTFPDDKSYPGFLFPSRFDYDEQSPQWGMFKNTLCESVVRHWLKGPSAVGLTDGAPNLGRTCLADIYDITKLTPDYLAYGATLIRHLLSVDGRWSGDDKRRTGHRFHTSLHRLLTVDYEAWEEDVESGDLDDDDDGVDWMSENIFSYYNRIIFGSEEGDPEEQAAKGSDYGDDDNDDDDNLRVCALIARKAELKETRKRRKLRVSHDLPPQRARRSQSLDYVNAAPPLSDLQCDAHADVQMPEDP